jgi:hypothetical protein
MTLREQFEKETKNNAVLFPITGMDTIVGTIEYVQWLEERFERLSILVCGTCQLDMPDCKKCPVEKRCGND